MKKIRVGIIGFGLSGEFFHSPLIQSLDGFEIVMVSSTNPSKVKQKLPLVSVESTATELINQKDIDLVVIASPSFNHFEITKMALEANKNVVVEKPFVLNLSEGKIIEALAIKQKKIVAVFHNRRWDSDFLTIKKVIESNKLGKINTFESKFDRYRPEVNKNKWRENNRPGAGVFYDIAPHLIDQALLLFGGPISVHAEIGIARKDAEVSDFFKITLYYKENLAILSSHSLSHETLRFCLYGEKGILVKNGFDTQESALRQGKVPLLNDPQWGQEQVENFATVRFSDHEEKIASEKGNYLEFYKNLYKALTEDEKLHISLSEALKVTKTMDLCLESNSTKKKVMF